LGAQFRHFYLAVEDLGFSRAVLAGVRLDMKRGELARKLAKEVGLPQAIAQDRIDQLVHRILTRLQRGQRVELPGIGKLVPKRFPQSGR